MGNEPAVLHPLTFVIHGGDSPTADTGGSM
jgi:hypothetical protein